MLSELATVGSAIPMGFPAVIKRTTTSAFIRHRSAYYMYPDTNLLVEKVCRIFPFLQCCTDFAVASGSGVSLPDHSRMYIRNFQYGVM